MTNVDSVLISFIILIVIIIMFILIGVGCSYGPKYCKKVSNFANENYAEWDDQLNYLKKNFQIGLPTGVLGYLPNQISCDSKTNMLVQSNVAFKPNRHGTGCSYINMVWPS